VICDLYVLTSISYIDVFVFCVFDPYFCLCLVVEKVVFCVSFYQPIYFLFACLVVVANALCLGNTAVSGSHKACDEVIRLAEKYGASKTVKLNVAGAFHSEFMRPAFASLKSVLETVAFRAPVVPVVFNVDGKEETNPEMIKQKLLEQVCGWLVGWLFD
jgi:hypothetical protein